VDDWSFKFYLFAWENCTVVSADVVVLGDPGQVAPSPSGKAGSDEVAQATEQEEATVAAQGNGGEASEQGSKKDTALDEAPAASDETVEPTIKKVKSKKSKDASKSPYSE